MEEKEGGETWEQTAASVISLIEKKIQIPGVVLERAHRVGQRRDARPRPIVARFGRFCDREAVMRNARKLKGTNIFINDDLCAASQAVKNSQMPLFKQARAQGKVAFFHHTKLIIKEKQQDSDGRPQPSAGAAGAGGRDGMERESTVAADAAAAAAGVDAGAAGGVAACGGDAAAEGPASTGGGAAAGAGGSVVATEVAGVWSGVRDESFPSLHKSRLDLRSRSPSSPAGSPQVKVTKKSLRSTTKK